MAAAVALAALTGWPSASPRADLHTRGKTNRPRLGQCSQRSAHEGVHRTRQSSHMSTSPSSSPPPHRAHGRASAMLGGTSRWPNPTTCVNGGFNRRRYSAPACRAAFERARVRVGASEHGWVRMVLCACRGVGGDVRGSWPCHWHARITQRRRVGELEPESYFLGVSGQFHDLVKRRKNRLRASSGGAPGRAHTVGSARRPRRRLAGLARRTGRGRANTFTVVSTLEVWSGTTRGV